MDWKRQLKTRLRYSAVGFLITLLIGFIVVSTFPVVAAAAPSVRIAPSKIEKEIRKFLFFKDTSFGPIHVTNNGSSSVTIKVYAEDLFQAKDGSAVFVTDEDYRYGVSDEIRLDPVEFEIAPGKTQLVTGDVRYDGKRKGGGYCVVFFESVQDRGSGGSMAATSRLGSLLYVVYPGGKIYDAAVVDIQAELTDRVLRVRFLLKDTGDIHIRPTGIVRLKDRWGNVTSHDMIEPATILPEASRWFECDIELPEDIRGGSYSVEVDAYINDIKTVSAKAELRISVSQKTGITIYDFAGTI